MDVSIVIPVKNESENATSLASGISTALANRFDYEIVLVDDGSSDNTVAAWQTACSMTGSRLRILRFDLSCGQSTAVWYGVHAARAPIIATLDGDGQNDPADIPRLVDALLGIEASADLQLVMGHRAHRNDGLVRRLSSRVANAVRSRILRDNTPDTGCGIKAFRREAFLALPYFDHMHRFLPALVQRQGGTVLSLLVNHRPRLGGRSKYGVHNRLWVGLVDLAGVAWLLRREKRPAKVREEPFV